MSRVLSDFVFDLMVRVRLFKNKINGTLLSLFNGQCCRRTEIAHVLRYARIHVGPICNSTYIEHIGRGVLGLGGKSNACLNFSKIERMLVEIICMISVCLILQFFSFLPDLVNVPFKRPGQELLRTHD